MNAKDIEAIVGELDRNLTGLRIRDIAQPDEQGIYLQVPPVEGLRFLHLSLHPELCGIYLTAQREPGAWKMKRFCALLRARVSGARIAGITQLGGDRAVRIDLETAESRWSLVVELTGRHGNLFLIEQPSGMIEDSLRPNRSRERLLYPGAGYCMMNPAGVAAAAPTIVPDTGSSVPFLLGALASFTTRKQQIDLTERRAVLLRYLETKAARKRRSLASLEQERQRLARLADAKRQADLLQIHFPRLRRGMRQFQADDLERPGTAVTIPLDPSLEPAENVSRLYAAYRRFAHGLPLLEQAAARTRGELETVARELEDVLRLTAPAELETLFLNYAQAADFNGYLHKKERSRPTAAPFLRFVSAAGRQIWVGKNAKSNHRLTFQQARGSDLWLHAADRSGPHVIVSLARDQEPDQETLLDAATLAVYFCRLRNPDNLEVMYARRKHLRPARGQPGRVFVAGGKTFPVRIEKERLERLLASRQR